MQAENLNIRQQTIRQFIVTFIGFILLCVFFFYWTFKKIPAVYEENQSLTTTQTMVFLNNISKTDTLVWQIQTKPNVKEESMVAFYEWMSQLKETYPSAFHHSVLDNYLKRVVEIEETRQKDTSLLLLQQQYSIIKNETAELIAQNQLFKQELEQKKALLKVQ